MGDGVPAMLTDDEKAKWAAVAEIARLNAALATERARSAMLAEALQDIGGVGYAQPKDAPTLHDEAVDRARAALDALAAMQADTKGTPR